MSAGIDLNATLRLAMAAESCLSHSFEGIHESEEMCRRLLVSHSHGADLSEAISIVEGVRDHCARLRVRLNDRLAKSNDHGLGGDSLTLSGQARRL